MSDPGREMYELMERLYPICRSLTGDGVRETLDLIEETEFDTIYHEHF